MGLACEEQRTIKAPTGLYYEVVVDDLRKTLQYKSSRPILISCISLKLTFMCSVCASFSSVITRKRDMPDPGWLHMQGHKKILID